MLTHGLQGKTWQKQHIATSIPALAASKGCAPAGHQPGCYHRRKVVPTLWVLSKSVNIPSDCKPTFHFRSWILEFRGSFSVFSNFSTQKRTFLVLFSVFTIFCLFCWASPARRCEDRGGVETTVPAAASAAWLRWAWRKAKRPKDPKNNEKLKKDRKNLKEPAKTFLRYGFDHEDMESSYVLQCTSKMPLSAFMASPEKYTSWIDISRLHVSGVFVPRNTHLPCRMQTPNASLCKSLEGLDVSDIFGSVDLITLLDTLCRAKLWCMSVHVCMYAYTYIYRDMSFTCIHYIKIMTIYADISYSACTYPQGILVIHCSSFHIFSYNKSCRTHFGNLLYWPCVLDPCHIHAMP